MTIDLFTIKAHDTRTLAEVIDALHAHCDTAQVEHFLADFTHWHRSKARRTPQREQDAAETELRQWQAFINRLPEGTS